MRRPLGLAGTVRLPCLIPAIGLALKFGAIGKPEDAAPIGRRRELLDGAMEQREQWTQGCAFFGVEPGILTIRLSEPEWGAEDNQQVAFARPHVHLELVIEPKACVTFRPLRFHVRHTAGHASSRRLPAAPQTGKRSSSPLPEGRPPSRRNAAICFSLAWLINLPRSAWARRRGQRRGREHWRSGSVRHC